MEISLYPTRQSSLGEHTSWIKSAAIANSEYANQDLNYLVHITRCQVQGDNHCPGRAGHTIADTNQDASGFLGHLSKYWLTFSCCQSTSPGLFPHGSFTTTLPLACSTAGDYCDPHPGPTSWPCRTSHNWHQPTDPACSDPSVEPFCPPAIQHLSPSLVSSAN